MNKKLHGYYEGYMSKEAAFDIKDILDLGSTAFFGALGTAGALGAGAGVLYEQASAPNNVDIKNIQNAYLAEKLKTTINAERRAAGLPDLEFDRKYAKPPLVSTENIKARLNDIKEKLNIK